MKNLLFVLLFSWLLSPIALCASDVSGRWSGKLEPKNAEGERGPQSVYMILKQDGNKLTGSGGPDEGQQLPIQNGKVEGDHLTFEIPSDRGTMYFDLMIKEDQLTGSIKMGREDTTQIGSASLKRVTKK